eukprot:COSAG02_NODE_1463_length_12488_cov_7.312591_9_plen_129_part_00
MNTGRAGRVVVAPSSQIFTGFSRFRNQDRITDSLLHDSFFKKGPMVHVLAYRYSGQYIYTHQSTSIMNIENSIEISYSGEYATGLHLSAPSASYPARLLGLTHEPLVEWMRTKPQHQPPGSTVVRTQL